MSWLLTAFIGASLGFILIQVIYFLSFYPKKPIRFSFFTWQGWIPRWINHNLPSAIENLLISAHVGQRIQEQLLDQKTRQATDLWITTMVGDYLTHTLPVKWPMISMLVGEKTHDKIKQALSDYLLENWDKNVKSLGNEHLSDNSIRKHVRNFMQNSDAGKWVLLIEEAAGKWKLRILLITIPLGALMAVLGQILFQALLLV